MSGHELGAPNAKASKTEHNTIQIGKDRQRWVVAKTGDGSTQKWFRFIKSKRYLSRKTPRFTCSRYFRPYWDQDPSRVRKMVNKWHLGSAVIHKNECAVLYRDSDRKWTTISFRTTGITDKQKRQLHGMKEKCESDNITFPVILKCVLDTKADVRADAIHALERMAPEKTQQIFAQYLPHAYQKTLFKPAKEFINPSHQFQQLQGQLQNIGMAFNFLLVNLRARRACLIDSQDFSTPSSYEMAVNVATTQLSNCCVLLIEDAFYPKALVYNRSLLSTEEAERISHSADSVKMRTILGCCSLQLQSATWVTAFILGSHCFECDFLSTPPHKRQLRKKFKRWEKVAKEIGERLILVNQAFMSLSSISDQFQKSDARAILRNRHQITNQFYTSSFSTSGDYLLQMKSRLDLTHKLANGCRDVWIILSHLLQHRFDPFMLENGLTAEEHEKVQSIRASLDRHLFAALPKTSHVPDWGELCQFAHMFRNNGFKRLATMARHPVARSALYKKHFGVLQLLCALNIAVDRFICEVAVPRSKWQMKLVRKKCGRLEKCLDIVFHLQLPH